MRAALLAVLALATSAFVSAATFEARSEHYALRVRTGNATVTVRVTDLETDSALVSEDVGLTDRPAEISRVVGNVHLTIRVSRSEQFMNTTLDVEQGEMLIDSIHANWILAPRRAHVRSEGAMRVGGDVKAPIVVQRIEPLYPEEARRNRVSGIVIIETLIDATGRVADVVVLKPMPFGLSEAALDAVKQWKFEPGTLKGKPVPVIFNLTVNFKLDAQPLPPIPY